MAKVRIQRLQELIRRDVAEIITTKLRDPRIKFGTVTRVKLTPDLKYAKIFVSCLGEEADQRTFLKGLESARGRMQKYVGRHMRTRQTPQLVFAYDDGIEKSIRMSKMIDDALEEDRVAQIARGEVDDAAGDGDDNSSAPAETDGSASEAPVAEETDGLLAGAKDNPAIDVTDAAPAGESTTPVDAQDSGSNAASAGAEDSTSSPGT